ncbi:MAG: hypothetical protein HY550_05995 [Elusimicrobia bacterium]|nr:hypothetical protein [Elusimicrobiota bacterium]
MRRTEVKRESRPRPFPGAALAFLLACGALCPAARASSPDGYPGSVWGNFSQGSEKTEGAGTQGWARQGVRWARLGKDLDLNTYAAYNWRVRTRNRTYYNTSGPSLIAAAEKSGLSAGAEFAWLRYPGLSASVRNYSLFAGWYASRDLAKWTGLPSIGPHAPLALPFSTWGKMSYDLHGEEGSGSQGWLRQGVDWFAPLRGWKFRTYAAYNWRQRNKNGRYYDVRGPSLGAVLSGRHFDLGAEYYWQRFPGLRRSDRTFSGFLSWYYNWDLKGK